VSEYHLIQHCAPTLAGIKAGSLFTCSYFSMENFLEQVRRLNSRLVPKGIRIIPLRYFSGKALVYVYRPSMLSRDLSDEEAARLLKNTGYCSGSCENCIVQLVRRLQQNEAFPHEIGLFLGYPAEDVRGFIENSAGNFKCVGTWKVYGDEESARKRFAQYKKCDRIYRDCWNRGSSLERLAVTR